MAHDFDQRYWDAHWQSAHDERPDGVGAPANPHLLREVEGLVAGTALEAGCGEGAEAHWLAGAGWRVTAVDIAADALARASARAEQQGIGDRIEWVQADLTSWAPSAAFDLVTTHYAHPAIPQLDFYARLSDWVAPGGSLLVVGHMHGPGTHGSPPPEAQVTPLGVAERFDPMLWNVVTAQKHTRVVSSGTEHRRTLQDVVVRAVRRR